MDGSPAKITTSPIWKQWLPVGMIALVAIFAGLVLPQALPPADPPPKASIGPPSAKGSTSDLTYVAPSWPEPPNHQAMFVRLGLGTVAVLALCAATLWGCKRWLRGAAPATVAGTQLRFVESLALGNRCQVHLIHVGNRPMLVGADAAGIKTIVPLAESFDQTLAAATES